MIPFLRALFMVVLAVMGWGTVRASLDRAMFDIPSVVTGNPWFQVTLFDAYFAFITFSVWVVWKEQRLAARILWVLAILLWGNFAMATYMLLELFRVPASGPIEPVFTRRNPGKLAVPGFFVVAGAIFYLLAARHLFLPKAA